MRRPQGNPAPPEREARLTYLREHIALEGFQDPSGGDEFVSYQGVPIVFQDAVESSAFSAVSLAKRPGVTRIAIHAPYHEGKPSYEIIGRRR
jgi:hypothetical protein